VDDVVAAAVTAQMPEDAPAEPKCRADPAPAGDVQVDTRPDGHDLDAGNPRLLAVLPLTQRQVRDLEALAGEPLGEGALPALAAADGVGIEAVVDEADVHREPTGRDGRLPP
jgi:hypothetical protein